MSSKRGLYLSKKGSFPIQTFPFNPFQYVPMVFSDFSSAMML